MRTHALAADPTRRYVLVLEDGEDLVEQLKSFAHEQDIKAADFTGIGAFRDVVLERIGRPQRPLTPIRVDKDADVISLDGDLTPGANGPEIRADVVLSTGAGRRQRGWLQAGHIRSTFKLIVIEAEEANGG